MHWFSDKNNIDGINIFLQFVKDKLIEENGILSVLGYFCQGFEYNFGEISDEKLMKEH